METKWKLGEDISVEDNLLDQITFYDLITAVHCNCQNITVENIQRELDQILEIRMQDMKYLVENNLNEIIREAKKGRES